MHKRRIESNGHKYLNNHTIHEHYFIESTNHKYLKKKKICCGSIQNFELVGIQIN